MIVEAGAKSGSLITARLAKKQNRKVYAVPNGIYHRESKGTNRLIADGANIYLEATQLLPEAITVPDAIGYKSPQKKLRGIKDKEENSQSKVSIETTELEQQILTLLENSVLSTDKLVSLFPHNPAQILEALSIMELQGKIKSEPGGKFSRRI